MDVTAESHLLPSLTSQTAPITPEVSMLRALAFAALNHLLTNELMAAKACRNASQWFENLPVAVVLRQVMDGHHLRAGVLYETIRSNGGHPAVDPHAQDDTVTPALSDVRLAFKLLLEVEQRGVAAYRQSLNQLDNLTRTMVEADLLSGQETALASIAGAQPPAADGAV